MSWILRSKSRPPRRGLLRSPFLVMGASAAVIAALVAFAITGAGGRAARSAPAAHGRTMAEAMAILRTAAAHLPSLKQVAADSATPCPTSVPKAPFNPVLPCFPGRPGLSAPNPALCPEPGTPGGIPIPKATSPGNPPGAGYGIPFVAAVSNVRILSGYDEWIPANAASNQTAGDTNYNNPWTVLVYNITGWVTGLLELPSLQASIQANQLVFCPPALGPGVNQCPSANASTGCAWEVLWAGHAPWTTGSFSGDCSKAGTTLPGVVGACLPYVVTLAPNPASPPQLTVLGLNAQGQLDVSATESANEKLYAPAANQECNGSNPTTVTLSSRPPSVPVPSTGPVAPPIGTFQGVPIPDYRPLQWLPASIAGPLRSISATLSGNDFPISSFLPPDQDPNQNPTCTLWFLLDAEISGYNLQGFFNYKYLCGPFPPHGPCDPVAAPPGWSQSTGQATVVYLGIPSQPPPGFSF